MGLESRVNLLQIQIKKKKSDIKCCDFTAFWHRETNFQLKFYKNEFLQISRRLGRLKFGMGLASGVL